MGVQETLLRRAVLPGGMDNGDTEYLHYNNSSFLVMKIVTFLKMTPGSTEGSFEFSSLFMSLFFCVSVCPSIRYVSFLD